MSAPDPIFQPLSLGQLTVKNRALRSSISGRFDHYDGSGTQARVNWEEKFARGGVGAIISSHVPVSVEGRHVPNYAILDRDERVPHFRAIADAVHRWECAYIVQLNHAGRQWDLPGVENIGRVAASATGRAEPFHGFPCREMNLDDIRRVQRQFVDAARRVREAGCDGIELHASNGYLISQFLSSAINDREDEYGGDIAGRARFLLEMVRAIRKEVGADFPLGVKLNGRDRNDAVLFWEKPGNTLDDALVVARLLEEAGVDFLHVSTGSSLPHPWNPPGQLPLDVVEQTYDGMISSGRNVFRNYLLVRYKILRPIMRWLWTRTTTDQYEGVNLEESRAIKAAVKVPVLCTGGFQTASLIRAALRDGKCDAVTIARPLIANNDLPKVWAAGRDLPDQPCDYCNRCLYHVLDNPLGCYNVDRYGGDHEQMIASVMKVFSSSDPTR